MTIPVKEDPPGTFTRLEGNPTMTSLDGQTVAPLFTILAGSWSAEDRAAYGVFLAVEFEPPEGYRTVGEESFERVDDVVRQVFDVEEIPEPPVLTDRQKPDELLGYVGLTVEQFKAVLEAAE